MKRFLTASPSLGPVPARLSPMESSFSLFPYPLLKLRFGAGNGLAGWLR